MFVKIMRKLVSRIRTRQSTFFGQEIKGVRGERLECVVVKGELEEKRDRGRQKGDNK